MSERYLPVQFCAFSFAVGRPIEGEVRKPERGENKKRQQDIIFISFERAGRPQIQSAQTLSSVPA